MCPSALCAVSGVLMAEVIGPQAPRLLPYAGAGQRRPGRSRCCCSSARRACAICTSACNGPADRVPTPSRSCLLLAQVEGGGGLTGTLPSFERAPRLRHVHLSSNRFSGALPAMPADTEVLLLNHNQLSGQIPRAYAALPLRVLRLEHNSLTGQFPPGAWAVREALNPGRGWLKFAYQPELPPSARPVHRT